MLPRIEPARESAQRGGRTDPPGSTAGRTRSCPRSPSCCLHVMPRRGALAPFSPARRGEPGLCGERARCASRARSRGRRRAGEREPRGGRRRGGWEEGAKVELRASDGRWRRGRREVGAQRVVRFRRVGEDEGGMVTRVEGWMRGKERGGARDDGRAVEEVGERLVWFEVGVRRVVGRVVGLVVERGVETESGTRNKAARMSERKRKSERRKSRGEGGRGEVEELRRETRGVSCSSCEAALSATERCSPR